MNQYQTIPVLSLKHLTLATLAAFKAGEIDMLINYAINDNNDLFVKVMNPASFTVRQLPLDIQQVMAWAHEPDNDYEWVKFDHNGFKVSGLDLFNHLPEPNPVEYQVYVSNMGRVYFGYSKSEAEANFHTWTALSKSGYGRSAGECVSLLGDGDEIDAYTPIESVIVPSTAAPIQPEMCTPLRPLEFFDKVIEPYFRKP